MNTSKRTTSAGGFTSALHRDPKKATLLAVLTLVLLFSVARTMLSSSPKQSLASSPVVAGESRVAGARPTTVRPSGGARGDLSVAPVQAWLSQPNPAPSRNPFVIRQDRYRRAETSSSTAVKTSASWMFTSLEKLALRVADEQRRQAILLENLQREAARLRLQSTVMGAQPKALIDGRLVREGDVIASGEGSSRAVFRVFKIEARRVVLECQGIRLGIAMQQ
jgi:hypothetical protein